MEYIAKSARQTQNLGKKIGNSLRGGEILALSGELGSGKTTFVQGLAKGLGIRKRIISPTFIIVRKYEVKLKGKSLFHVDLYRLEGDLENEIKNLGLTDICGRKENIVAIEWAEKIKKHLPESAIWVRFENLNEDERKVIIIDEK